MSIHDIATRVHTEPVVTKYRLTPLALLEIKSLLRPLRGSGRNVRFDWNLEANEG